MVRVGVLPRCDCDLDGEARVSEFMSPESSPRPRPALAVAVVAQPNRLGIVVARQIRDGAVARDLGAGPAPAESGPPAP